MNGGLEKGVQLSTQDLGAIVAALLPVLSLLGAGLWRVTKYLIDTSKEFLETIITSQNAELKESLEQIELHQRAIAVKIKTLEVAIDNQARELKRPRDQLDLFKFELLNEIRAQTKAEIEPMRTEIEDINQFMVMVRTAINKRKGPDQK